MEWKQATPIAGGVQIPDRWVYLHYYETFNLLFRIENALRVFVYTILKSVYTDRWTDTHMIGDDGEGTIASVAKRRKAQSQAFGYLGHAISCPIMHLTSGELSRLITSDSQWDLFKSHFPGKRDVIRTKLEEIGTVRNSFAHFRPVKPDDVDVVKQDSKQVLAGVELYLAQALSQGDVVPTNSDDAWYKLFRVLGSDHCTLRFNQSRDEKWIRIALVYDCPVISHTGAKLHASFKVLTLNSSAILSHCAAISRNATYLAEAQNRPIMHADRSTDFHKWVYFVLPRSVLAAQHQEVGGDLSCLLTAIARETTLIQQDNHARGDLVRVGHAAATAEELEQGRLYWTWSTEQLRTPVQECDPPEYWGDTALGGWMDFIGGTTRYPWMPGAVSSEEIPF